MARPCIFITHGIKATEHALTPFPLIKDHVLLRFASELEEADAELTARMTIDKIAAIVELIPDAWLADDPGFDEQGCNSGRPI